MIIRNCIIVLILFFLTISFSEVSEANNGISIILNDQKLIFDQPPVIEDGTVLVPMRALLEKFNMAIEYDSNSETVTAKNKNTTIIVTINSKIALINNNTKKLRVAPRIINSRTMVPIRFISEALGDEVVWHEDIKTVNITNKDYALPIFIYHWVVKEGEGKGGTPLSKFREQLDYLQSSGFETVTPDDVYDWLSGKKILGPRSCMITFDDGNLSVYTLAFQEVKKRKMKMTLYINPSWMDNQMTDVFRQGQEGYHFNWEQAREMVDSGLVNIQNHTYSHQQLDLLSKEEQKIEIVKAQERIKEMLGYTPYHLAYPYGSYNQDTLELCRELGVHTAVTVKNSIAESKQGPWELKRISYIPVDKIFRSTEKKINFQIEEYTCLKENL
ncbi:MAG: hypothetical protein JL50_15170 [Peptococcaceae bacterium BICA1-7]|nr:MAG: hypothetical protein JL50_15170 [Peptococcaceae bacterium BICA1-7]